MAELFTLSLTDNTETINFIGTTFKVVDGGFDIGMPQTVKTLSEIRPGFFKLASKRSKYRTAKLTFAIHGATREAVLTSLAQLERVLNNIESQEWMTDTTRGQLSYAFDGASQMTYFEVYAGDLKMPADLLSIRVAHAVDGSGFYIQDISLKLYLSPVGYGLSIFSQPGASQAIPLNNPSQGTKTTGWIEVGNLANDSGVENWVEIASTDVPGGQPYVTSLQAYVSSSYDNLFNVYIGKVLSPFPTDSHLVYETEATASFGQGCDYYSGSLWTQFTGTYALGGYYRERTSTTTSDYGDFSFPHFGWYMPDTMAAGMYLPFAHGYGIMRSGNAGTHSLALGLRNYYRWGLYTVPEPQGYSSNYSHYRMTPIQLPPSNPTLKSYGTALSDDLMLAYYAALSVDGTSWVINLDYVMLLPINHGLRVWRIRRAPNEVETSTMVDNTFSGIHYNLGQTTGDVWQGFNPTMQPIQLTPNKTQRLYFNSRGYDNSFARERNRMMMVKLWGVPTFETLAY